AAGRFGRRRPLGPLAGGVGAEHAGAGHLLRFGRGGQAAGGRAAGERPARADLAGAGGRPPRCRTPRSPPLSGDAGAAVYRALVDAVGQDNASAYAMELAGAEEYDVFL